MTGVGGGGVFRVQYNTIQYNTIQHNTMRYNTIQCNAMQYSTVQYSTVQYSTIQYNTTLFYYATHTQQKLVSRWGVYVGKHVTIKYIYPLKIKKKVYYMESVRSSRRHVRRGGKFVFEIRERLCGLCLIEKIGPEHCTTILKAALQKICVWPWKC